MHGVCLPASLIYFNIYIYIYINTSHIVSPLTSCTLRLHSLTTKPSPLNHKRIMMCMFYSFIFCIESNWMDARHGCSRDFFLLLYVPRKLYPLNLHAQLYCNKMDQHKGPPLSQASAAECECMCGRLRVTLRDWFAMWPAHNLDLDSTLEIRVRDME